LALPSQLVILPHRRPTFASRSPRCGLAEAIEDVGVGGLVEGESALAIASGQHVERQAAEREAALLVLCRGGTAAALGVESACRIWR
jgi:hypothetical protein